MVSDATALDTLTTLARQLREPLTSPERFALAGAALEICFGWKVFSAMRYHPASGLCERVHSSAPDAYPVGGSKPRNTNGWSEKVYDRGEIHIGRNAADIAAIFDDHALIASLGCAAIMNIPVRFGGLTFGALNLMDAARRNDRCDPAIVLGYAALMIPVLTETAQ